ncbi:hypothetical protein CONLIGDRAFT_285004 [Coniochaeta ligniaria NRRL 30616]|uniref:Uncharacterized protein n=1 Tax=Coniochaeta ligniaria NRRL 30616 TaxID=1408157 RepID=A0A1J7JL96_9PEZI|nr:hypothetical protein CONLIGDRAFT_285004 [Coniochaeta ligniaria NRRL 30616]
MTSTRQSMDLSQPSKLYFWSAFLFTLIQHTYINILPPRPITRAGAGRRPISADIRSRSGARVIIQVLFCRGGGRLATGHQRPSPTAAAGPVGYAAPPGGNAYAAGAGTDHMSGWREREWQVGHGSGGRSAGVAGGTTECHGRRLIRRTR